MKLLIVLSIIAYGCADKLDRTYLPPVNAATAGGSPGALVAPGFVGSGKPGQAESGFGPGFSTVRQPGSGQPQVSYGGISGSQNGPGFGTGINQGPGGINRGPTGINQFQSGSGLNAAPGGNGKVPLLGANAPFGTSQNSFELNTVASSGVGAQQTYSPQSGATSSQGFGQQTQGFNVLQAQTYKPERPQAAADRNAEILKYINENNGESYLYSYETSNGISAEESGDATNGVKAQGGFSYTGDDGQAYSLTYTADENGFQPQGEHLPTPHPIPEEILKSIEENARAAAAGTQEGAYRPEEYESEDGAQQYNAGLTSFNRPQGQNQGSIQGSFSQGPATQAQNNQLSENQGAFRPSSQSEFIGQTKPGQVANQFASSSNRPQGQITQYQQSTGSNQGPVNQFGQSGQIGQVKPNQASNQFATGQTGPQGQSSQYQTGIGSSQRPFGQSSGQGSIGKEVGQTVQGQGSSGYNYNQPQNNFGSGGSGQIVPQENQGQKPSTFGSQSGQGNLGLQSGKVPSTEATFGISQFGLSQSQNLNKPDGNKLSGSASIFGQGQNQLNVKKPFGTSQESQFRPGSQGSSGPFSSVSSGYQYETNANRPIFGNRPNGISSRPSQGSQYPNANQAPSANNGNQGSTQFGAGNTGFNGQIQGPQNQQNGNRPFGVNSGSNQGASPFGGSSVPQKTGSGSVFSQTNQPSFGSNVGLNPGSSQLGNQQSSSSQGTSGPKGPLPIQAPYQYNRPSQSFPTQQRPGSPEYSGVNGPSLGSQSVNGRPDGNSIGSQGVIGQYPGYTGSQGISGRPAVTGTQGGNVQRPDGISSGPQGVNGQRPDASFSGSQGSIGRPDFTGTQGGYQRPDGTSQGSQGVNGQRPGSFGSQGINKGPDGNSKGSQGISTQGNQGRPEQFGGPRQPPSFNPQEGYKY